MNIDCNTCTNNKQLSCVISMSTTHEIKYKVDGQEANEACGSALLALRLHTKCFISHIALGVQGSHGVHLVCTWCAGSHVAYGCIIHYTG